MNNTNVYSYDDLIGKTFTNVYTCDHPVYGDKYKLCFELADGGRYVFYHDQDCCESVYIEDICGELSDLEGTPILLAEETSSEGRGRKECPDDGTHTYTFYKFATIKDTLL